MSTQVDLEEAIENQTRIEIRKLNDLFRGTFIGGKVVFTEGFRALSVSAQDELITMVREFKDFNEDNDPYGEHEFGKVTLEGKDYFWKIDYYDKEMEFGSTNPADPKVTTRVLTIMRADEY